MLFFNYIKLLLKKWYVYLSLIPVTQGFSVSYFDAEIYFKQSLLWGFALLTVFVACYSVWLEQKQEYDKLQKDLMEYKNKFSSFELTAVLKKIYVDDDFSFCLVQKKCKDVREILEKLESELDDIAKNKAVSLARIPQPISFFSINTGLEDVLNEEQLIQYKAALKSYLEKSNEYQARLQHSVSEGIKNCYLVEFYIKNTSKIFDENIDLSVSVSPEDLFLDNNYLSDLFLSDLNIPKRRGFNKAKGVVLTPSYDHYLENDKMIKILNNQSLNAFYKYFEIQKHGFSLNIKELKANESVKVTRKAFVAKLSSFEMIQYHVSSICSGQNLTGNVVVDLDVGGISYEEVMMNQEIIFLECEE